MVAEAVAAETSREDLGLGLGLGLGSRFRDFGIRFRNLEIGNLEFRFCRG